MIIGIVAIAKNYAIGRGGKLPWHYSADLKFFKATTVGNAVVMGSATWRSIGKPLAERLNIVLTRSGNVDTPPAVMRLSAKAEVVELSKYLNRDVYILGGASVFGEFADVIDEWIVTLIPETVADADTFMPMDFLDGFTETGSEDLGDGLQVKTMRRK